MIGLPEAAGLQSMPAHLSVPLRANWFETAR